MLRLSLWLPLLLLHNSVVCVLSRRTWDFEIISGTYYSSDEDIVKVRDVHLNWISLGNSVFSAKVEVNYEINEDTTFEFLMFYSPRGRTNEYFQSPYQIPKQKLTQAFLDKYYNVYVSSNLENCANIPKTYKLPIEGRTYILEKCSFSANGFPDFLPYGYYKLSMEFYAEVHYFNVTWFVKVTPKLF